MWGGPEVDREYVMKPVQGQAQLMWAMWKQSSHVKVPTLSVTGNMETLEVDMCMGGQGVTGVYGSDAWEGRVSLVCCTVVMRGRAGCHWCVR